MNKFKLVFRGAHVVHADRHVLLLYFLYAGMKYVRRQCEGVVEWQEEGELYGSEVSTEFSKKLEAMLDQPAYSQQ